MENKIKELERELSFLKRKEKQRKEKEAKQIQRDKEIVGRFMDYSKEYSLSKATELTAKDFDCSLVHIYDVRKRVAARLNKSIVEGDQ